MRTRLAEPRDSAPIARIFNEGIEERIATFETEPRTAADIQAWLDHGDPVVVAEDGDEVIAWAAAHPYSVRAAYAGVGDYSVYVARGRRRGGVGRVTLEALLAACEARGYWKLVSRIFPQNEGSLALARSVGFQEVGVYRRHGRLDGEWRDCVVVERLLGEAAD
jgi:L-amino acid N-acyltransferase YncA